MLGRHFLTDLGPWLAFEQKQRYDDSPLATAYLALHLTSHKHLPQEPVVGRLDVDVCFGRIIMRLLTQCISALPGSLRSAIKRLKNRCMSENALNYHE